MQILEILSPISIQRSPDHPNQLAGWCLATLILLLTTPQPGQAQTATANKWSSVAAEIGSRIFLDESLSSPPGQACSSCHQPKFAFADPRVVSTGAVAGRTGKRNSPSLMYAALIPALALDEQLTSDGSEVFLWEGGQFRDGRARDLFEQVRMPFFDSSEMNLTDENELANLLRRSEYFPQIQTWLGAKLVNDDQQLSYHAFRALVQFLREPIFRPFAAKIDDYLAGDKNSLSESQKRGLEIFLGSGRCNECHMLELRTWDQPLLSDFGYDNLGV
ncbi:MAG: hypothetical protein KDB03_19120, partial [Planctomycetales bacterium]|nr:hypothetical protein [Planctomycetales bacterium]